MKEFPYEASTRNQAIFHDHSVWSGGPVFALLLAEAKTFHMNCEKALTRLE